MTTNPNSHNSNLEPLPELTPEQRSLIGRLQGFCLHNRLIVGLFILAVVTAGIIVAPFDWNLRRLPPYPRPRRAIPRHGENQQIVFTEWPGRSPQDIEDQLTYPLTVALIGLPDVKTVRSYSYFGFSTIYVIFKENVDFYWSRSRLLEKLNSLPAGTLPADVQPTLGPDATPLGQIFWYTLEGRDPDNNPAGGFDLEELRTIQDYYVRYWLAAADGVAEVASVGGYVREYQIDVDPDAMRAYGVSLIDVFNAVKASNIDVGAKMLEINRVEYLIRGIGFVKQLADLENSVIKVNDNVPVLIKNVATVALGPALRRGALDKGGAQAVGGVVVARYGDNPLAVINNVKQKITQTAASLPAKVLIDHTRTTNDQLAQFARQHNFAPFDGPDLNQPGWLDCLRSLDRSHWPAWATISQLTVVPFYDRTGLIYETLATLNDALLLEILITIIVVLIMVAHLRSSALISSMLPLAVLLCFVAMKVARVDANIVALSGIVIAIGTIVDMGIVICENILRHLDKAHPGEDRLNVIHRAAAEVGSAVLTAVLTTVVGFLPVFTMAGPEGKLFKPLAYTKTFALLASIVIALTVIPPAAYLLFCSTISSRRLRRLFHGALAALALALAAWGLYRASLLVTAAALALLLFALARAVTLPLPRRLHRFTPYLPLIIIVVFVGLLLTQHWLPLGPQKGLLRNLLFVALLIAILLLFFKLFQHLYPRLLAWCLAHKILTLSLPTLLVLAGATVWIGFDNLFAFVPATARRAGLDPSTLRSTTFWVHADQTFPGLGKEFMPPLDEGSYLYMPTTMPHASIGEALDVLAKQDLAFQTIPEIDSVVGKIGRAQTPLDPAPISMIETVINYKSEYRTDDKGRRLRYKYDCDARQFLRDDKGQLIPDPKGRPFRNWRDHITSPDDIWHEIVQAGKIPGTTSAPRLQPIAARLVMLQSGMRAPMGVKIKGPSLEAIEHVALQLESLLKQVPSVEPDTVLADRVVGKPYLEIIPDRNALARYGVPVRHFHDVVEIAIGGKHITTTVQGRLRFPVRVRYLRERRDTIEKLQNILVPAPDGAQIPIAQLARIRYVRGPQMIKSEDTFLVGYVVFDKIPQAAEVDVVQQCQAFLQKKINTGQLTLPPGLSYTFAGTYQNQVHAQKTLALVLPLALFVIFIIIYLHFRSVATTLLIFSGILVAWAGGFLLLHLYAQPWFLDLNLFGVNMRHLFQIHPINLSVAVWVGFLALFGIATDDGVVMATYLQQTFRAHTPTSVADIRNAVVTAGSRRVRACLMTTATTVLALLPVLTSTGRGADVMVPMAIPSFGGMLIEVITMLVVPVLYCASQERKLKHAPQP